jgi:hypothetical protein
MSFSLSRWNPVILLSSTIVAVVLLPLATIPESDRSIMLRSIRALVGNGSVGIDPIRSVRSIARPTP